MAAADDPDPTPDDERLLYTYRGVVASAPVPVFSTLADLQSGPRTSVDRDRLEVAEEGGWWFRAEMAVVPHPRGALVTSRILNVATVARWAVPMANRMFIGARARYRQAFADELDHVGEILGVESYLLDG